MITRRDARRWGLWTGVGLGALGMLVALFSVVGAVGYVGRWREVHLGRGALTFVLRLSERTTVVTTVPATPNPTGPPAPPQPVRSPFKPHWKFEPAAGRPWVWLPLVRRGSMTGETSRLVLPWWLPAMVGLFCGYWLLPAGRGPGRCVKCGFDLRRVPARDGLVTCPECGTVARSASPVSSFGAPAVP